MKSNILVIVFILICCGISQAQVNSSLTIDFKNPALLSMEIDRSQISVQLTKNFASGPVALSSPVMVTIKSNVPWALAATANTDFLCTDNALNTIPCSQLEFKSRLSGSTENVREQQEEYLSFAKGQAMTIARGDATPNEGLYILVEYRLVTSLKNPAGNYSLPLVFTLSPSQ
ncbi:MAG: hypothetical protein Q7U71_00380 [bacterium]|nr:hypothetical protein [bacterium]